MPDSPEAGQQWPHSRPLPRASCSSAVLHPSLRNLPPGAEAHLPRPLAPPGARG